MQQSTAASPKMTGLAQGFRNELELLSRHIRMLQFVQQHGPIGIIRLSQLLAVPKHKVRYSLRILEQQGYIRPSTTGASITDKAATFLDEVHTTLEEVVKEVETLRRSLTPS